MGVHVTVHGEDNEKLGEWVTENDGTHRRIGEALTFSYVSTVNADRANEWHHGFPEHDGTGWTGGDWGNALAGEVGEACNVIKKLRRHEVSIHGAVDPPPAELLEKLGDELADAFIYLDLVATKYGVDLAAAIVRKFNKISERENLPQRLEL